jgi:hypothetical protein
MIHNGRFTKLSETMEAATRAVADPPIASMRLDMPRSLSVVIVPTAWYTTGSKLIKKTIICGCSQPTHRIHFARLHS